MHLKSQAMNALHLLIVDAATLRRALYRYGEAFIPFFKQKTAYGILRSDWSSDVCSSD
eukprot:COSAG01_NODE_22576_length_850_cov_0.946738_1_plen_57_part_10